MIRVIFFDIDGTLVSSTSGCMSHRTHQALATLKERGVRLVIATGRHPLELDTAGLDGSLFDGYAAANGQMCLDERRTLFAGFPIGSEGTEALARLFEQRAYPLWFFGERESYANVGHELLDALALTTTATTPEVRAYDGMTLYQAVALVGIEEEPRLAGLLPGCRLQRWGERGVDIIAAEGGKVAGMSAFLERFGCSQEDCMAFGDQHNDVDMLRFAAVGVAMGNASDEAKGAADHITTSVDDDGIVCALEHFGILERGWDCRA